MAHNKIQSLKLVTFDCYSALFDYESSLVSDVKDIVSCTVDNAREIVQLWRAKQLQIASFSNAACRERISFRDCTKGGLDYALRWYGKRLSNRQRNILVTAWDFLEPWPEANEVLGGLRRSGYEVAFLSNGDRSMLERLEERLQAGIDYILSSEYCGFYKPYPAVYSLPSKLLGIKVNEYLHVAGSVVDAMGATAAGGRCYWSNRKTEPFLIEEYVSAFSGSNLYGLLEVLEVNV